MFEHEIGKGVALLDEKRPNWREKVDLDTLDMKSQTLCVLGQVFGSYGQGLDQLNIDFVFDHGFSLGFVNNYETLTQEWKDYLSRPVGN